MALGAWVGGSFPSTAQTIVPAADGTATLVMPNGNTFNITGGQLSGDGRNLFHSFQEFGLSTQQIANFIANPQIQNILGRVVGGNPSFINGLLQVSGANANLFLMNPSGIVFGPNAALNVPASFAATTATGINFGAGQFNAFGANNYSALTGTPQGFVFQGLQPGAIVNAGNLSVNPGEGIALVGSAVINTGTINAPGGEITLTAVPGAGLVRISQKGQVLSLEVPLPQDSQGNVLPFQPTDLPALLTGSGLDTGLTVTPNGAVALTQSGTQIPTQPGTAIVSGTVNVSSPTSAGGTTQITGAQVGLVGAQVQADGLLGGGTLRVGGDYRGQGSLPTAENTFVSADSNLSANALEQGDGGRITVWAEGNTQFQGIISAKGGAQGGDGGFAEVSGKENLAFQGQVNLTAPQGELGTLLLDPENITIVSSSGGLNDSQLPVILFTQDPGADYTISESALEALAGTTNIQLEAVNNITIDPLLDGVLAFQSGNGTITFSANADNLGGGDFTMSAADTLSAPGRSLTIQGVNLNVGSVDTSNLQIPGTPGGNIALSGTGNIQANGVLNTGGGAVTLSGANITLPLGASILTGDSSQAGGSATLTATGTTLIEGTIFTYGNPLTITSGSLTATADAWLDSSNSANPNLPGGPIILINTGDAQLSGYLFTAGGPLTVTGDNININETALVFTDSLDPDAVGGTLTLQGTGNVQIGAPSGGFVETGGGAVTASGANVTLNIPLETPNPNPALPGGAVTLAATGTNQINSSVTTGGGNFSASGASIQIPASSVINVLNGTSGVKGGDVVFQSSGDLQLNQSFITNGGSFSAGAANLILPEINTGTGPDGLDAGAIILNASGNIQTGNLLSYTSANRSNGEASRGGDITLNAGGSINTTAGTGVQVAQTSSQTLFVPVVTSGSATGNGGNISFTAGGDITSAFLGSGSLANGTAGTITLTSQTGGINATQTVTLDGESQILGAIITASNQGQGGNVTLTAPGNIQTGSVITGNIDGVQPVGSVTITSSSGSIDTAIGANISPLSEALLAELGVDAQYLAEASQIAAGLGIITVSKNVSGGAVTLNAQGDITTTNIITGSLNGAGGNINLLSETGSIDASSGVLLENVTASFLQDLGASENLARLGAYLSDNQIGGLITLSVYGNGGDINLSAPGGIITNYLVSNSYVGQGGNITLNSANGSIQIGGLITSINPLIFNVASDGLTLDDWNAIGSLLSQGTLTTAGAEGGAITLTAGDGIELITADTEGDSGAGGAVTLAGGGAVTVSGATETATGATVGVNTVGATQGGDVTATGAELNTNGEINTGGGDITLTGTTSNQVNAALNSGGGDVALNGGAVTSNTSTNTNGGSFTATGTNVNTSAITTDGGTVTATGENLSANGEINTGGGAVNLTATGGAQAQETIATNGGNVTVTGAAVTTADIDASSGAGTGGSVTLNSQSNITTGILNTSGTNGGNVTLNAPGDIEAVTVNAQATTGTGGTVEIRAGENVRVTGTLVDQNGVIASISTAGGAGGGPITIQAGNVPFVVGNPSLNGTAGAITSGENTISAGEFNFTTQQGDISLILRPPCGDACVEIEDSFNPRYVPPFTVTLPPPALSVKTLEQADDILSQIEAQTGKKPALIYVNFVYPQLNAPVFANAQFQQLESARVSEFQTVLTPSLPDAAPTLQIPTQGDYQLELVVITRGEDPLRIPVPAATQRQVITAANRFRAIVSKQQNDYQTYGAQLYQWIIAPLEDVFKARGIDSALFFLPNGLRTLPLAALYDEKEGKFAVEKPFAIGTAPSLNLVDYRYRNLNAAPVLAFGATEFSPDQQQTPLPGVGVELSLIRSIKGGEYFLNPEFNLLNVESQRRQNPLPIVHLATHADFLADSPQASYIQLYNQKLELPQWDRLDLNLPATDLLVISACNSAVGNWAVELGFGGMAVQAGVKTALASLWPVGDIGTVGLMDSFYRNLKEVPIKSEALQLAQRALLNGQYRWVNDRLETPQGEIEFKGVDAQKIQSLDLTHPYFWASFLMIGSPW
ncbi:MAG: CHAT domain-containing protein [Cyanobacteriota bacterium]